ncbi:MAG: hypothetical protein HOY75_09700 [Streptomyces sp.]|nr:hypothetical protein [Streptomyces sp.]
MSRTDGMLATFPATVPGRYRDWISVPRMTAPTVWLATPDGLVSLDLIAIELAMNGRRKGWTLNRDEARYAVRLMLDRGVPYAVISTRVGASAATLRSWFPGEIEASADGRARARPSKPAPERKPRLPAQCGTYYGARAHVRRKEPVCPPCREAKNAADRYYRVHGTYVGAPAVPSAMP